MFSCLSKIVCIVCPFSVLSSVVGMHYRHQCAKSKLFVSKTKRDSPSTVRPTMTDCRLCVRLQRIYCRFIVMCFSFSFSILESHASQYRSCSRVFLFSFSFKCESWSVYFPFTVVTCITQYRRTLELASCKCSCEYEKLNRIYHLSSRTNVMKLKINRWLIVDIDIRA